MNHPGEIEPLSHMVKPHLAIITEIAAAHLEFFDSVDAIADAKAEIFDGITEGGACILPADNLYIRRLISHARAKNVARITTFGASPGADFRLINYRALQDGAEITASIQGKEIIFRVGTSGRHLAMNSLAVLGAAHYFGLDIEKASKSLEAFQALLGRGKKEKVILSSGGVLELIDESYNASPASMRAALHAFTEGKIKGRRIAILGDMRELGAQADKLHADLIDCILDDSIQIVYLCGPHMAALWKKIPASKQGAYALTSTDLIEKVTADLTEGDRVLVKGSLGTRMAPIVESILAMGNKRGTHVI